MPGHTHEHEHRCIHTLTVTQRGINKFRHDTYMNTNTTVIRNQSEQRGPCLGMEVGSSSPPGFSKPSFPTGLPQTEALSW